MYNNLKSICESKGMSITALCVQVTNSKGNLATWKKGKMTTDQLQKCAEILNVPVDVILNGSAPKAKHPPVKLPEGAVDEIANKAIEAAKAAGMEVISIKASDSDWDKILDGLSPESLVQLRDYVKFLYWKQAQVPADKT